MGFDKIFNKYVQGVNSLNKGVNKVVGKEIFKDVKQIEAPREFPPYNSFPAYTLPEPEQWSPLTGEAKEFTLQGSVISVSANLDACLKYRKFFEASAEYYTEQFKFKYQNCVQDYDTLIHYFTDVYIEGLGAMLRRAYSLLLPFGVFTADLESFGARHGETYNKAVASYETMVGIEMAKNQAAENLGNQVGGAVHMQGGGFGMKGAMKGVAKAEAFNIGMGLIGKFTAQQNQMTQEEKAKVFAEFRHDIFFQEVYSDYFNTFFTLIQTLAESGELDGVTTNISTEYDTMVRNLQNPMFPQDKVASALAKIISSNPFVPACFELLGEKFGQTEETSRIVDYFAG